MSLQAPPAGVTASSAASTSTSTSTSTSSAASGNSITNSTNNNSNNNNSNNSLPFEKDKIWYFSNEQLGNSPSRRCGIKSDDELHYRQMTAYLIQEMGQRLQVSQLCINTAIVYMHRFYAFHSFTHFHRNSMASASLFLAAKVEEQPRKLEHVIRAANKCLPPAPDQSYADLAQELVFNENVLLQTLGFDVAIDHPHTHVVRTCQLVKACKDLAQTSYFLASNSLHLTSMCLQYRPTVVACFCIYLACKWSRWEIPQSTEGKHWFYYVDKSVSLELLKQLTDEFIAIYEKSPARLKSKLNSIKAIAQGASNRTSKDNKPKEEWKMSEMMKGYHSNITLQSDLLNGSESRDQGSQAALLPPPTMVPPSQRRSDVISNHQRSSSVGGAPGNASLTTSSSSSNHKLPSYPGALPPEAHGDHKSKQPVFNNRAPSGHQSSSSSTAQRSSTGSSSSSSSSQRSSSSQQSGRPPMPMDYHKSSRGMLPPHKMSTSSSKPQQPPPPLLDSRSNSSASNATATAGVSSKDVSKSSSSSSKMYPNPLPQFSSSSSGPPNPLMSRGGYQSITPAPPGGSNGSNAPPAMAAGYGSHGSHRNKSVGTSGSSSSVHSLPPYEQQLPYGQSQGQPMPSYNHMQPLPQEVPPSTSTMTQTQQQSKNNSLFSPEWSDVKKEPQFNGLLPPPPPGPGHDSLGYKLNNHARNRDSPKKERLTPTKKDKHRSELPTSAPAKPMLPPPSHKKPHGELTNELAGSNLKRANEISGSQYGLNKLDEHDGSLPRDKMRKLDTNVSLTVFPSYEEKHTPLSMPNGVGAIETTPDLVRSLLKESLCTASTSLLKPDALTMPGLKPPAELLEPMPPMSAAQLNIKNEPLSAPIISVASNLTALPSMELDGLTKLGDVKDLESSVKSEKKKKKDKHKHKEKDKSKDKPDKEERKKHKKDKQKERSSKDTSMDSLKLVIKTNTTAANPNGSLQVGAAAPLKLKISKNKVEPNNYSAAGDLPASMPIMPASMPGFGLAPSAVPAPVTSLSISTSTVMAGGQLTPGMTPYGGYSSSNSSSGGGSGGSVGSGVGVGIGGNSSSGKKKHSDRDRDKDSKKSKTQDYAKYNGVAGVGAYAPLGGAGAASSNPGQQGSISSLGLLGLPPTMTTASLTPNSMVMTPGSVAAGITPSAVPIYNKK